MQLLQEVADLPTDFCFKQYDQKVMSIDLAHLIHGFLLDGLLRWQGITQLTAQNVSTSLLVMTSYGQQILVQQSHVSQLYAKDIDHLVAFVQRSNPKWLEKLCVALWYFNLPTCAIDVDRAKQIQKANPTLSEPEAQSLLLALRAIAVSGNFRPAWLSKT